MNASRDKAETNVQKKNTLQNDVKEEQKQNVFSPRITFTSRWLVGVHKRDENHPRFDSSTPRAGILLENNLRFQLCSCIIGIVETTKRSFLS